MRLPGVAADGFSEAEKKGPEAAERSHPEAQSITVDRVVIYLRPPLLVWTRKPGLSRPKSIPYLFTLVARLPVKSGQQREPM